MKKFSVRFLFISLIFFVSLSSISFLGYSLNNKVNNNTNTEETIDVSEQIKNAFVFNHKKQIEEVKQNKNSIKNKINNNITNISFSQISRKLSRKDLILWNYYASYEINENFSHRYSLNDFMICFVGQDFHKFIQKVDWEINISFYLTSENGEIHIEEKLNKKNYYGNNLILINDFTDKIYINNYLHNHFFILNLNINNVKIKNINEEYYLDLTENNQFFIKINFENHIELTKFLKPINGNINIFNLSYNDNFYSNNFNIIINNFLFLNENIGELNLNILIPEKIKIDELLNNLTIYADYKSYDNSKNGNNYELNFEINDNYYKYPNSNWYNVTFYINNFSKEEGMIYYNFSFFYNNEEIFLNEWINNFKVITPLFPPEIKDISYSENPYFKNSFYINIKFDKKINYQMTNNLIFYYKNNGKKEYKNLTSPIYLSYQDMYRYEINFTEDEINDENEMISLTNFIFINSGYFEYDYLTNSFIKNYQDNKNYLNSTGYKYFFYKPIIFKNSINNFYIDVIDSKIIRKNDKYYLDVFYHANQKWSKNNINLINKINFNYFLYNSKNNSFTEYFENLYISKISNLNYLDNNLEVIYEIQTFNENSIYSKINFIFNEKKYFLPKKIYSTNFTNKKIENIKIKKIKNNSIIFDISYNDVLKIQADNLKVTYKDENDNNYDTLEKQNLTNNGVIDFNNNEITYEYTLTNLNDNTEYKDFNIYLLNSLNSDYKYDWFYSYFLKPSFSTKKTIKTKNKILIIILSLLILILYFSTFLYFLFKYFKYKKSIL